MRTGKARVPWKPLGKQERLLRCHWPALRTVSRTQWATPTYFPPFVCLTPSLPGCARAQCGWPPAGRWDNGASSSCKLYDTPSLFSWPPLLHPGGQH